MPAERSAATLLNRRHDLELAQAQVAALNLPKGWPVGAEDIRDLQGGALHERALWGWSRLQGADHLA